MHDWTTFLSAMALALIRISGVLVFAPLFGAAALPSRAKVVLAGAIAYLLAPLVATLPGATVDLTATTVLGELAVGLVYGLSLALLNEALMFAGQMIGMQFSYSLVNLMDPASSIQTPLMSDLLETMGTLVVIAAGLDRVLLASVVRSFHAVPLGGFLLAPRSAIALVDAAGGIFLAAVELAAPVLAATMLVEVAIGLMGKLSPQLPVTNLTIPLKTLSGFLMLTGSLALWPSFIEGHFGQLLDMAERLLAQSVRG